jgi:alkyl hydroperoxide reductase subunit AhpF
VPPFEHRDRRTVALMLRELTASVRVHLFVDDGEMSRAAEAIWMATAGMSRGRVSVARHGGVANPLAQRFDVSQTPTAVFLDAAGHDSGSRFFGAPSGYLYQTVVDHLLYLSQGHQTLSGPWRSLMASVREPLHVRVWTVPNCPHCPQAVRLAERMAAACPKWVRTDIVEAYGLPNRDEVPDLLPTVWLDAPLTSAREAICGVVPEAQWIAAVEHLTRSR